MDKYLVCEENKKLMKYSNLWLIVQETNQTDLIMKLVLRVFVLKLIPKKQLAFSSRRIVTRNFAKQDAAIEFEVMSAVL